MTRELVQYHIVILKYTPTGTIKEILFPLSLCSFRHQWALRNNEISANIHWKDAACFEDHLLPNCLGHLHGIQGGFQRVSRPCYWDKRETQVFSVYVYVCVWFNIWWGFIPHKNSHVNFTFLSLIEVVQIESVVKTVSRLKEKKKYSLKRDTSEIF